MSFKQTIASVLRRTGLSGLTDKLRYYFSYSSSYFSNRSFAKKHPDFVFPPPYFIYETYTLSYKDYYEDGKQTAGEIVALLKPYFPAHKHAIHILDWGCGPARVVRQLPLFLRADDQVYGCDYNHEYIRWNAKAIKGVHFISNEMDPPVNLPDHFFDAVYGLSIFTHLSEKSHTAWINELNRLLVPGGILLITTQGEKFKEKLLPAELQLFESGQLVVRGFEKEGHRMYSAFQPETYMKQLLKDFKLLRFIPGGSKESVHEMQDTWIVEKVGEVSRV